MAARSTGIGEPARTNYEFDRRKSKRKCCAHCKRQSYAPKSLDYILDEFQQQLERAHADASSLRERTGGRTRELEEELQRLTLAVAEGGHSSFLLEAITARENELAELNDSVTHVSDGSQSSTKELREFTRQRISDLPDLLSQDVPRARAQLAKHVGPVTLTPTESEGSRHYQCQGQWDLLGKGDVRMVAGGGFEPPTFGL